MSYFSTLILDWIDDWAPLALTPIKKRDGEEKNIGTLEIEILIMQIIFRS